MLATVGHGATTMWYFTRASGLVALVLLSATVVVGIVSSVGWASERWPRFVSQGVHRNLSVLSLTLVVIHVITTVADGFVPITLLDAVVPFASPYRPVWVGLGACAFDLLVAVGITSALRHRIGRRAWRMVHWAAYACWPIALFHGLGSGSDTHLFGAQFVYLLCAVVVIAALGWRLIEAQSAGRAWRVGAGAAATLVMLGAAVFAFVGPLAPGWSRRSGTSPSVLAEIAAATMGASSPSAGSGAASSSPPPSSAPVSAPAAPFTSALDGTVSVVGPDVTGHEQVVLTMRLQPAGVPLVVSLSGSAVDSGVALTSSNVTLGALRGQVTSLEGTSIGATVSGQGTSESLVMELSIDQAHHVVSGSVSASPSGTSAHREREPS